MSTQFSIYSFKTSSTSPKEPAHQRFQENLHLCSKEEVERLRAELRSLFREMGLTRTSSLYMIIVNRTAVDRNFSSPFTAYLFRCSLPICKWRWDV